MKTKNIERCKGLVIEEFSIDSSCAVKSNLRTGRLVKRENKTAGLRTGSLVNELIRTSSYAHRNAKQMDHLSAAADRDGSLADVGNVLTISLYKSSSVTLYWGV